jgi:hypothetical protein
MLGGLKAVAVDAVLGGLDNFLKGQLGMVFLVDLPDFPRETRLDILSNEIVDKVSSSLK